MHKSVISNELRPVRSACAAKGIFQQFSTTLKTDKDSVLHTMYCPCLDFRFYTRWSGIFFLNLKKQPVEMLGFFLCVYFSFLSFLSTYLDCRQGWGQAYPSCHKVKRCATPRTGHQCHSALGGNQNRHKLHTEKLETTRFQPENSLLWG